MKIVRPIHRIELLLAGFVTLSSALQADAQNWVDTAWVVGYDTPFDGVDFPAGICVDVSHNVYAMAQTTGAGTGTFDILLLKYRPNGTYAWGFAHNGPSNGPDYAHAMALDGAGNAHVCGARRGITDYEMVLIKFKAPNRDTFWVRSYDPYPVTSEACVGMSIDAAGGVYVVLNSENAAVHGNHLVKFDINGNRLWERSWNDSVPGFEYHYAAGCDLDSSTGIYVLTGDAGVEGGLLKYAPDGELTWARRIECDSTGYAPSSFRVSGNRIYVAGQGRCGGSYDRLVTAAYTTDGDSLWMRDHLFPSQTGFASDSKLEAGPSDGIFATVWFTSGAKYNSGVVKYDANGSLVWEREFARPVSSYFDDLSADSAGNVYVSGVVDGPSSDSILTVRYDADGALMYELLSRAGANACAAVGGPVFQTLDAVGNVYVMGRVTPCGGTTDMALLKYSPRCACFADPACEGTISDAADVVTLMNVAFRGHPQLSDADCPRERTDIDCSGATDIADVVHVIDVAFRGTAADSAYCDPTGP